MVEKKPQTRTKRLIAEVIIRDGRITVCGHSDDFNPEELIRALKGKGLELEENFNSPCG